jgi:mono/diheme cytochrome c family protein
MAMKLTLHNGLIPKCAALFAVVVFFHPALNLGWSPAIAGQQTDGIYSEAQSLRGEKRYDQHCASCHGFKLDGQGASPLTGEPFMKKWGQGKHTVDDLFYIIRTQMPYGAGGTLTRQEYIDIVAYILKRNGYQAGDADLPLDTKILRQMKIAPQTLAPGEIDK